MRLFLHEVRTEQRLFWRNREAAFFTFLLPIIFFLIFGSIYGSDFIASEHVPAKRFLQAGMVGYGVASTAFAGLAITMVIRRESGVLKRIRATPLPAATYLIAVLGSTFLVFLVQVGLLLGIGRLLFHIPIPDRLGSLFGALILGATCFAAMGLGLTTAVRSAEGASAVVNVVYLPMAIISGTFFSPRRFPPLPTSDRRRAAADLLHQADAQHHDPRPAALDAGKLDRGRRSLGRRGADRRPRLVPLAAA